MKGVDQSSHDETLEDLDSISTSDLEFGVHRTRFGITKDARMFLRICAIYLEHGVAPPFPYAHFLAERLFELASRKKPWGAALLKRTKGQKGADELDRKFEVAKEVWEAFSRCKSVTKAADMVAERRTDQAKKLPAQGVMIVTLERAKALYKQYRKVLARKRLPLKSRLAKVARAAQKPRPLSAELLAMMMLDAGAGMTDAGEVRAMRRWFTPTT